jgi:2-polyprenyl-6-methoxyphenol hydroxylase-like FAD-dependent oxidoreductase
VSATHDALVIGAGPAGATAALVMARAGLDVAVVEKAAFPRRKVCGEFISATSWPLLRDLGVAPQLLKAAGPPVRRVALYAGDVVVDSPMPAPAGEEAWGRAVGREHLDSALLAAAGDAGAEIWQPWSAVAIAEDREGCTVTLENADGATRSLRARVLVAAHGSWEPGELPTQRRRSHGARDLLGFKAHFRDSRLPAGWMPLVLFPGGYGGLVHGDGGRTSFSCCVRRGALRACRRAHPGLAAGEALLLHVMESCRGMREALEGARREAAWLSAGPIDPGIRTLARGRMFAAGNAAGEAHPLVAEGISMAIQSGWLLGTGLAAADGLSGAVLGSLARRYDAAWRGNFAARLRASSLFAALTTTPGAAGASVALLHGLPAILTWGARWSGKARAPRPVETRP